MASSLLETVRDSSCDTSAAALRCVSVSERVSGWHQQPLQHLLRYLHRGVCAVLVKRPYVLLRRPHASADTKWQLHHSAANISKECCGLSCCIDWALAMVGMLGLPSCTSVDVSQACQ